jgi:DNA processing protein
MNVYPPENRKLAQMIAEQGLLVSEFPLHAIPDASHFPRRNRIIAGCSLGTVVIEANDKSGALITARLAAEQGREIFAVPGPIFSKMSLGPHRLLRDGAKLLEKCDDILEEIQVFKNRLSPAPELDFEGPDSHSREACPQVQSSSKNPEVLNHSTSMDSCQRQGSPMATAGMTNRENLLFDLIHFEPIHVDALSSQSRLATGEFAKVLLSLEMKGKIRSLPGKRYVRN